AGNRAHRSTTAVELLRKTTDENAIKWVFHRGTDSRWSWRKTSIDQAVIASSARSHATYCDCVSDAKAHGYREWLAPAKLRPLSFSHVPGLVQVPVEAHLAASQK